MTGKKLPQRKSKTGRNIVLVAAAVLLVMSAIYLTVKQETIWNIFHLEQIEMRSADEVRTRVREGAYDILTDTEDELIYTASDGAVTVRVLTEGDGVAQMTAEFNAYDFDAHSVSEAEKHAFALLSPYYTDPQMEALVFVIAADIAPRVNDTAIDYTKKIGGFSLNAAVHTKEGDVQIKMTRSGAEG